MSRLTSSGTISKQPTCIDLTEWQDSGYASAATAPRSHIRKYLTPTASSSCSSVMMCKHFKRVKVVWKKSCLPFVKFLPSLSSLRIFSFPNISRHRGCSIALQQEHCCCCFCWRCLQPLVSRLGARCGYAASCILARFWAM